MSSTLTLNPVQRDALLWACDGYVECLDDPEMSKPAWVNPAVAPLVDDLLLPDERGEYRIANVPRGGLILFLEHQLSLTFEGGFEPQYRRIWHTCIDLLDRLGHELEGDIYEFTACHCQQCEYEEERKQRFIEGLD